MSEELTETLWWRQRDLEGMARSAWAHVGVLENLQKFQEAEDRMFEQIYLNRRLSRRGPMQQALGLLNHTGFTAAKLNITRAKLDTLMNKVAKMPPAIRINPDNSKYSLKRRARKLRKFLMGKWHESDAQRLNQIIFRDAGIVRTGVLKVVNEFGDIKLERVRRREIFVDPREGRDGKPRQMHQKSRVPREVLFEMFKGDTRAQTLIMQADPAPVSDDDAVLGHHTTTTTNLIELAESIHLKSSPDAKDGVQVLSVSSGGLVKREWKRPRFPWCFFDWSPRFNSFWGSTSLVEQLADIQWKINETVRDIQEAIYFGANPMALVRKGTGVNPSHLAKRRGLTVVEYDGTQPPIIQSANPVSEQKIAFLRFLLEMADDITGVSQLAQAAKNPLGADASGVALQEFDDRESERFFDLDLRLGLFWRDVAEACIDTAKEISEELSKGTKEKKQELSAIWQEGSLMRQIKWADVDMKRDQFSIQLEPTNFLPDTRAGKLAAAERLAEAGVIKGSAIPSLLDYPDVKKVALEITAPRDAIEAFIELVDDESEELPTVDPHMNLPLLGQMLRANYNRALAEKAPTEILKRFRDSIKNLIFTLQEESAGGGKPSGAPIPGAELAVPANGQVGPALPEAGGLPAGPAPAALPGEALPGVGAI